MPSFWFHLPVSLTTNIQCNSRSGSPPQGSKDIRQCGFRVAVTEGTRPSDVKLAVNDPKLSPVALMPLAPRPTPAPVDPVALTDRYGRLVRPPAGHSKDPVYAGLHEYAEQRQLAVPPLPPPTEGLGELEGGVSRKRRMALGENFEVTKQYWQQRQEHGIQAARSESGSGLPKGGALPREDVSNSGLRGKAGEGLDVSGVVVLNDDQASPLGGVRGWDATQG